MREHIHKFQWFYFTFLAIIFGSLGFYYIVKAGFYPIVIVGNDWVFAGEFNATYAAAYYYYARSTDPKEVDVRSAEFRSDLRRAVLQEIIEKALVRSGLNSRIGDEAKALVSEKIGGQNLDSQKMKEAAELLYGMTDADFLRLVLVPRAEREVLEARLRLENKKFDAWLSESAKSAKVFIVTPEFYWENGNVKIR